MEKYLQLLGNALGVTVDVDGNSLGSVGRGAVSKDGLDDLVASNSENREKGITQLWRWS